MFIEDIGEYLYQLDRMMISLRLAGKFDHLAALLVGDFSELKDNDNPFERITGKSFSMPSKDTIFPLFLVFLPDMKCGTWPSYWAEITNSGPKAGSVR